MNVMQRGQQRDNEARGNERQGRISTQSKLSVKSLVKSAALRGMCHPVVLLYQGQLTIREGK